MRAVGYLRLSRSEGGHGLQAQRAAVQAFCARRGLELVAVFEDDGASGRTMKKRPGLAAAIEACRAGEAEAVVSTRVDRLARSSLDAHRIFEQLQKVRATVLFSEQESFSLDTPEGRMLVGILASFAAFEADLISARTKAALDVVRKNGSKSGRPIGNPRFRRVPVAVSALVRELRSEGTSYRAIAATLNERGFPTQQGGSRWHAGTVLKIAKRAD